MEDVVEIFLFVVALVIVLVPSAVAVIATGAPTGISVFRTTFDGPDNLDDAQPFVGDIYRGHVRPKATLVVDQLSIDALPKRALSAAAWCRVAFCVGMVTFVPVAVGALYELATRSPGMMVFVGIPGFALSCGQIAARNQLLHAKASAAKVARAVGGWTLVHNVLLIVAMFAAAHVWPYVPGWYYFRFASGGAVFVAAAIASSALAVSLFRAATDIERWQRARNAI